MTTPRALLFGTLVVGGLDALDGSLRGDVWSEIDRWIDAAIGAS